MTPAIVATRYAIPLPISTSRRFPRPVHHAPPAQVPHRGAPVRVAGSGSPPPPAQITYTADNRPTRRPGTDVRKAGIDRNLLLNRAVEARGTGRPIDRP